MAAPRPSGLAESGGVIRWRFAPFAELTPREVHDLSQARAAAFVVGTPVAIGMLMRVDRDKAGSARERERQRFAAHLHDSVLQTLALVQRQAHDPIAVARLVRAAGDCPPDFETAGDRRERAILGRIAGELVDRH